jgi:hypothetical protein
MPFAPMRLRELKVHYKIPVIPTWISQILRRARVGKRPGRRP